MDPIPGLTKANHQKRALVIESELNRQVLRVEVGRIRVQAERLKHHWAHGAWKWAVPVAGFLLARKYKHTAGIFAKASLVVGTLWKVLENRTRQKFRPGVTSLSSRFNFR